MPFAIRRSATTRRSVASIVALAVLGCGGPVTAPDAPHLSELLGARVPTTVAPGVAFDVVGYFGRGACDRVTKVVEPTADGVSLALVHQVEPSTSQVCIAILLRDSVVAHIGPEASRPFIVRLRQSGGRDSIVVVRAR